MGLKQSFLSELTNEHSDDMLGYLISLVKDRSSEDISDLIKAVDFVDCHDQGSEVKQLLSLGVNFNVDVASLTVLALYPAYSSNKYSLEDIANHFSNNIINLLGQSHSLHILETSWKSNCGSNQSDTLRKLFLSTVNDLRIIIVRLIIHLNKLHNCAITKSDIENKAYLAKELYAPLANRLGLSEIKWQLEDLAFRFLLPNDYHDISENINETRMDRQNFLHEVKLDIEQKIKDIGDFSITGRVKHFYSIYNKMKNKKLDFKDLYDIHAIRIITDNIDQCYVALGVINSSFTIIDGEFDDYIANPKANGYQSIHTAIKYSSNKVVEVQIRTQKMHDFAESGFASHWLYKEGGIKKYNLKDKANWLNELVSWHDENEVSCFNDRVFVFTPEGDVKDMQLGSTVIDFAYNVHTSVGHRCKGAKINNKIVPLNTVLKTSDQVQILTGKYEDPKQSWLKIVYCSSSRSKINQWFKRQDYHNIIARGKLILSHASNENITLHDLDLIANNMGFNDVNSVFLGLGEGRLSVASILQRLKNLNKPLQNRKVENKSSNIKLRSIPVLVEGFEGVLINLAHCCSPLPGDSIVGRVTRQRGVVVHRRSCLDVSNIVGDESYINVQWVECADGLMPAKIKIITQSSGDVIQKWLNNKKIPWGNWRSHRVNSDADLIIHVELQVGSLLELKKYIHAILLINHVASVKRL